MLYTVHNSSLPQYFILLYDARYGNILRNGITTGDYSRNACVYNTANKMNSR